MTVLHVAAQFFQHYLLRILPFPYCVFLPPWCRLTALIVQVSCVCVCGSSLPVSVRGVLQARRLEWVAAAFSRGPSWASACRWVYFWALCFAPLICVSAFMSVVVIVQLLSHFQLFVTPWTAARQASLPFTISRSLLKLMSTLSDAIQPSHPLFLSPPAFSLSQHQDLF